MFKNISKLFAISTLTVLITACGGGTSSDGNAPVADNKTLSDTLSAPVISSVASVSKGEVVLSWQASASQQSLQDGIRYSAYASKNEAFDPGSTNLVKDDLTIQNDTLKGLEPGLTYYFKVVASNGTEKAVSNEEAVTVSLVEAKLAAGVTAKNTADIKTKVDNIQDNQLAIDPNDGLQRGDVIVDESTGTALIIEDVDATTNQATVKPADVGDVFESISINSSTSLELY
ncbi:fibronectin type III domain-containing protein [Thiomicrorhabdus sp. 6S2-11]|uniref:Fibronectin type III domain-containing protein n=1 Tax=Thiomicrorhabdus marina TaxID=2818442 RepID=A0ABS3Q5N0_9GAMM|nr:fibronectin type III domain-containing protein [Thiomicrorhabdus marina]MBO1927576.1 fibronectin type III domain-containing protein [Thiomicrorhabdus marina]